MLNKYYTYVFFHVIKYFNISYKQVKNDSFFNFFDPPPLPEDPEAEVDAETQELLTADFEIGHYIRERIIPRAVLFFTGNYKHLFVKYIKIN